MKYVSKSTRISNLEVKATELETKVQMHENVLICAGAVLAADVIVLPVLKGAVKLITKPFKAKKVEVEVTEASEEGAEDYE